MKDNNIITIDGPSASGKGSLAKALAKKFNLTLLDSGLLYRAYAYLYEKFEDHNQTKKSFLNLKINSIENEMYIFEDDIDITSNLRQEKIAVLASAVSSVKETRENLIHFQRDLANDNGLVADGRDMGTVVFPNALTKFFLSASPEKRAYRRYEELMPGNPLINLDDVMKDIYTRDKADKKRDISPLMPATDAIIIDSSELTKEEVLDLAIKHYTVLLK